MNTDKSKQDKQDLQKKHFFFYQKNLSSICVYLCKSVANFFRFQIRGALNERSRKLLATTETLEKLIAALAITGESRMPKNG